MEQVRRTALRGIQRRRLSQVGARGGILTGGSDIIGHPSTGIMKLIRLVGRRVLVRRSSRRPASAAAARPIPVIGARPSPAMVVLLPPAATSVVAVSPLIRRVRRGLLLRLPVVMRGTIGRGVMTALWRAPTALRVVVVTHDLDVAVHGCCCVIVDVVWRRSVDSCRHVLRMVCFRGVLVVGSINARVVLVHSRRINLLCGRPNCLTANNANEEENSRESSLQFVFGRNAIATDGTKVQSYQISPLRVAKI